MLVNIPGKNIMSDHWHFFIMCLISVGPNAAANNWSYGQSRLRYWSTMLVLALIALLPLPTLGQEESVGCYVQGECVQSYAAAINVTGTPQECLQVCQVRTLWYWRTRNCSSHLYFTPLVFIDWYIVMMDLRWLTVVGVLAKSIYFETSGLKDRLVPHNTNIFPLSGRRLVRPVHPLLRQWSLFRMAVLHCILSRNVSRLHIWGCRLLTLRLPRARDLSGAGSAANFHMKIALELIKVQENLK